VPIATTLVGIITAIGTVLTALSLVITAVTARNRDNRIERKVDEAQYINKENHKMLNSEKKERMDYQRALIRFIETKGLEVPIDQSVNDTLEDSK